MTMSLHSSPSRFGSWTLATSKWRPLKTTTPYLFKGSFYDKDVKKVGIVMTPDTFFDIPKKKECIDVFTKVGLDAYIKILAWGIDVQRSYELMTTINKEGVAKLINKEGQEVEVNFFDEIISEALKLPHPSKAVKLSYQLSDLERKATFLKVPGQVKTFKDLVHEDVSLLLCLYSQHFTLGKPQRYTHSNKWVAGWCQIGVKATPEG